MLSSVANYLFGAGTEEETGVNNVDGAAVTVVGTKGNDCVSGGTETAKGFDLTTSPADLDWELVDRVGGHVPDKVITCPNRKCSCANSSSSSSECNKLTPCCSANHGQNESSSRVPPAQFDTFSCNSNTPSEGGSSDSEGWLVTPPPCFTAGGSTEDMEVSPLENLLIEHPSMSVYHKKSNKNSPEEIKSTKQRPASARSKAKQNKKQVAVQSKPPCRPKAVAERAGILVQLQSNKTSQRQKQKSAARKNTKKAIVRQNRVKEFKSEGRHRNCTDRKMNRSGRMSIRAC